jgi:glutamate transport system permease protein
VSVLIDNLPLLLRGFWTTLVLSVLAGLGALVLGTLLAALRVSPSAPLRGLGYVYVELLRNTPLTVVFFFMAFGLPQLDLALPSFFLASLLALVLYTAAFVCEAIRAGINTVPAGQAEAARAIGMSFRQTLTMIILPQAGRAVIAPLGSIFIALAKNATIVGTIGLAEASNAMKELINANGNAVVSIFLVFAGTFAVVLIPTGYAFGWLANRLAVKR